MTDYDPNDDENQALADDEGDADEAESTAPDPALQARIVLREMLDEVQNGISRTRTAGLARVEAAAHLQVALSYLGTPHVAQAAIHTAWSLSYLDIAAKRSKKLPAALAARWSEVRAALPPSVQEAMGGRRQRAARPMTLTGQGEQRRGA